MNESKQYAEMTRIVEAQRAGRQRMDDYRAILVEDGGTVSSSGRSPRIIYRKGTRFRTDRLAVFDNLWQVAPPELPLGGTGGGNGGNRRPDLPQDDEKIGEWWKKRVQDLIFAPVYIDHGPTQYRIDTRDVTDPDGSKHLDIAAVQKSKTCGEPPEALPACSCWTPEFACRSLTGIPGRDMDTVLDMNPADGPPGTILLYMRRIGPKLPPWRNRQGNLVHHTTQWRYWLDPARDYVTVRLDMITEDESGNETTASTVIDEMARSPKGVWHATRIRQKDAIRESNGQIRDEICCLYLDFDIDLIDSLFDLPAVGYRIY